MSEKDLSRKQLYDMVWSKPVTHIAKEFGFSDNGIRKICKKHNIPLPKTGYWSKLKHNKKVVKDRLPKQSDNPEIKLEKTNPALFDGNPIVSKIALRKKEFEEIKELSFKVPEKLTQPHKHTIATKEYHKQLSIAKKKSSWGYDVDSSKALSIAVSSILLTRALLIFDTFIKIIERRGYPISVGNKTEVTMRQQTYSIRITEKNTRVKREDNSRWDSYDYVPNGNLCLKIDRSYTVKEWSDTKTKVLEDKLDHVLAWLEITAKQDEEQQIANDLWHKQYQEKLRKEKDSQILKDKELNNFENLFSKATRWHKSQYLRNYIKEFEEYALKSNTLDATKQDWIKWAKEKADWYDPFIEKDIELLKDIDRDTLKPVKNEPLWTESP